MKPSHRVRAVFDDPNLVSTAGLVPVLRLGERAGLYEHLEGLTVPSANAGVKTVNVIAGMLTGADSIDDLDVLRHGGMRGLFHGVRAPSTLGTFLRSFTHGHVQQLDKINAALLAGLAAANPALVGAGDELHFLDIDDTIGEVHGYAKQAAAYGYSGVKGLNMQVAALSSPGRAPVITRARLRRGNVASAAGAGDLLTRSISTARAAGVTGQIMVRADSAYYGHNLVGAAVKHGAWFSVTARMNPAVTAAIASIPEQAWTPIRYPHAIWEETEQRWISDAQVAEVPFTAFTGRRKGEHVPCRLVVRRVKRLQPLAGDGSVQGELLTAWRHHAFITNSTLTSIDADQQHRGHALIEQVIAELKDGPLAHLPSGRYTANAAWTACAVIAFNLARAAAATAAMSTARWATLRTRIINVPARIAHSARRITLHLPRRWPWAPAWNALTQAATGPPTAPAS